MADREKIQRMTVARAWIAHALLWQAQKLLTDAACHLDDRTLKRRTEEVVEQVRSLVDEARPE